ncbi:hypothetical protein AAZX31_09G077400 [Glycine max]
MRRRQQWCFNFSTLFTLTSLPTSPSPTHQTRTFQSHTHQALTIPFRTHQIPTFLSRTHQITITQN